MAGSFWLDLAMRTLMESPTLNEALLPQVDGRQRIVIEGVYPEVDGGQFPIKRVAGESVVVEADIFADGHDSISCQVLYRSDTEPDWRAQSMHRLEIGRWRAEFQVTKLGRYRYTLEGWIDPFKTWRQDLMKRIKVASGLASRFPGRRRFAGGCRRPRFRGRIHTAGRLRPSAAPGKRS